MGSREVEGFFVSCRGKEPWRGEGIDVKGREGRGSPCRGPQPWRKVCAGSCARKKKRGCAEEERVNYCAAAEEEEEEEESFRHRWERRRPAKIDEGIVARKWQRSHFGFGFGFFWSFKFAECLLLCVRVLFEIQKKATK